MTEPDIVVVADPEAAAAEAAERIARTLTGAVERRGRADWATTGGSTPIGIYRRLIVPPLRDRVPWDRVHTWWGDDRLVPPEDDLSNRRSFEELMLGVGELSIPRDHVHPFETGGPDREAERVATILADELHAADLPQADGWPVLDLILLGIGGDGHLLSVFPGSAAFGSTAWALAIPAPTHIEPHVERVTLNPALIGVAREILFVATGASKATVMGEIYGPVDDPQRWPAQLARRPGATWILDAAAAAELAP